MGDCVHCSPLLDPLVDGGACPILVVLDGHWMEDIWKHFWAALK